MTVAVVTGARGFLGRHLVRALRESGTEVAEITRGTTPDILDAAIARADLVFHLAGVNRPSDPSEFQTVNVEYTRDVLDRASKTGRAPVFVFASSTQANEGTTYGLSKLAAEQLVEDAASRNLRARIYRLPGVFGRGCRPMYNSVVATFCHLAARGRNLPVNRRDACLRLVHVDDVVRDFVKHLHAPGPVGARSCDVEPVFDTTVGELADRISAFAASRRTLQLSDFSDAFTARLYGTYLSYLPADSFAYPLEERSDDRGVLAEFLKSPWAGQLFVSRTCPGATRGNHWHSVKAEKFLVVEGDALISFRQVENTDDHVQAYRVTGQELRVLDIPPGYAHSIENVGNGELIVLFWASEVFDPAHPDTHPFQLTQ